MSKKMKKISKQNQKKLRGGEADDGRAANGVGHSNSSGHGSSAEELGLLRSDTSRYGLEYQSVAPGPNGIPMFRSGAFSRRSKTGL